MYSLVIKNVIIETATDSNGYFELNESYSFMYNQDKTIEPEQITISDLLSSNTTCSMFRFGNLSGFNNDTVFFFQSVNSVFSVNINPINNSTEKDTLFLQLNDAVCGGVSRPEYRSVTPFYSIGYNKYYVGPFQNNEILDTFQTWIEPYIGHKAKQHYTSGWLVRGDSLNVGSGFQGEYFSSESIFCKSFQSIEIDLDE